ncbi:MAG: large-conductance mechanosensitive channel protein MscL [Candidatus Eremiobacteraeota bacterium]|nr:large-conductance mechanosensitive channel protein MscL [Candidatus Eremiobacteraeota bacterium]
MGLLAEFKEFALKGNVVDMAVGIVIGAGFGKIVSTFVENVVTPPLGLAIGGVSFNDLGIVLKQAVGETPAVVLKYGVFLQAVLDFVIVAAVMFAVVKAMNSLKRKEEAAPAAPPEPSAEEKLLTEIRDLLAAKA